MAWLAGDIALNVLKEELPEAQERQFSAFARRGGPAGRLRAAGRPSSEVAITVVGYSGDPDGVVSPSPDWSAGDVPLGVSVWGASLEPACPSCSG